ncbi:MAG: peptide chain release factor N(5)-glutamine methyltransferase [Muribaculaceae bacterium]
MMGATVDSLYRGIIAEMTPSVGGDEARSAADIIFEDVLGYDKVKRVTSGDRTLEDFTVAHVDDIVRRFVCGEPLQYLIGRARFYGLDFKVTPAVLIPRPETAGLVDEIVADADDRSDLRVLDCGTGSGCIAIALARNLRFPTVDAIDISDDALAVARENAADMGVNVNFMHADMLAMKAPSAPVYDIIVSNPPYICDKERGDMDSRVLDYEPAKALFVADDDPLRFYRAVAAYAVKALKPSGRLYFEINPLYVSQLRAMLGGAGFDDVTITRDYKGNYRFCAASF